MNNTWTYNNQPIDVAPDKSLGFVYRITNTVNGMEYIGKKNFFGTKISQKTVTVKSTGLKKKKKIRTTIDSNWREYFGSSEDLLKDVEIYGEENFRREILKICYSKGEISYYEAKYQFDENVLFHPEKFYNKWIMVRVHRTHLK